MVKGLRCECKECGEVIEAVDGEGLLSKKVKHKKLCHPGFTDAEQTQVDDPRTIF